MLFNNARTKSILTSIVAGTAVAVTCGPAHAADWFDRISAITGKLPVVQTFIVFVALIIGLGALLMAGSEMIKISKPDQRGEATWKGILIKGVAGAILMSLSVTSDTFRETVFGRSSSTTINVTMVQDVSNRG